MKRGTQGLTGLDDRRLEIHTENTDGVERVRVRGEVDLSVVGKLDSEMRRRGDRGRQDRAPSHQLDFLDAAGVRLLLDLAQRSRRNGRRLQIKPGNSPQVRRVLELTGVVEHLPLEADAAPDPAYRVKSPPSVFVGKACRCPQKLHNRSITVLALAMTGAAVASSPASARSRSQAHYLAAANKGVKQTNKWWNHGRHWYASVLGGPNVASLWGIVPLFEALNGLQLAQSSSRHRHQLNRFARGAERYLNPNLKPVPGFGPKPGQHSPGKTTWFDDNGWWGLAFLDAYRATGNARYLNDAMIAQRFISVSGWDTTPGRPGGDLVEHQPQLLRG